MNEVVIPLKLSGVAALKAELRSLKDQMADAANPEAFAALADKAGEVTKKINSINSAVNEFKKGSNLDQVKNSFEGMSMSLQDMDFTAAAKQSANLKQSIAALKPEDLTKQFTGFITTIKNVGGAFVKLGITILMNPIFLITAAVIAIVAVVALVLKSFGKLDDVMKAMMAPINAIIAGFKAMTDWLGLTTFAAEDNAEKSAAANKKVSESSKLREAQVVGDLGREIAELKAAGIETAKQEEEVSNTKIREANVRKKEAKKELDSIKALDGKFYEDKRIELKKQVDAENDIIKQANSDKVVAKNAANKKESDDLKAKTDADNKEAETKAKAARDKRIAADKASQADIDAAAKVVSDSKKTAQQIELDDLAAAYKIKIAEATKHKNDTTALVEAQKIQEKAIADKYTDIANAKIIEDNKTRIALEDAQFLEMQRLTLSDVEFKKLQATQAAEAKMNQFSTDAEMVKLLETELAAELVKIQDDANKQKTANLKAETDKQKAIDQAALQAKKSIISSEIDAAKGLVNLLGGLGEKNKKIQKAALIANAALSIAEIINNTNVGTSKEVATKGILGLSTSALLYIKMATSIASVVAATAKGLSALGGGSVTAPSDTGGGGGGGGNTSTTAVAPASGPSLFGQANTGSQVTAGGGSNNITVTAIVSETEITASQNHINNIQQNSVL
jgi:hypothetical protein